MSGRVPVVPIGSPVDVRFWALVDRGGGTDACWPFLRSRDKDGYGKFTHHVDGKQKTVRAHRMAFELTHGRPPTGFGLHDCDNPPCCNPAHIKDGDQKKNRIDCVARGRTATAASGTHTTRSHPDRIARGDGHGNTRVPDVTIARLRDMLRSGSTRRQAADSLGLPMWYIGMVANGRIRRDVFMSPETSILNVEDGCDSDDDSERSKREARAEDYADSAEALESFA